MSQSYIDGENVVGTLDGILLDGDYNDNKVAFNTVRRMGGYGVNVGALADALELYFNDLRGNASGALLDANGTTIKFGNRVA